MLIRSNTESEFDRGPDTVPTDPAPPQVHVVRPGHYGAIRHRAELLKAAERQVKTLPPGSVRPMGHCHELQAGAFDRERDRYGVWGERMVIALFLLVLLGLAAGWFN